MRAVGAAIDKKALEPVLSYIGELTSYADYVLIVSGRSDRQVQAIAEGIALASKQAGVVPLGVESTKDGRWTLIDLGDVIVHVFHHPVRDYYDLEGLWGDAPRVKLTIPADCRARPEDAYTT
ncbi:MAG: ribosome silencing factor [Myxococcales bacterium]|nr:ribosome silencing factor [Myxococcales bacterium]